MPRKANIMLGSPMFFCHIPIGLHYQLSRMEIRGGWLKPPLPKLLYTVTL